MIDIFDNFNLKRELDVWLSKYLQTLKVSPILNIILTNDQPVSVKYAKLKADYSQKIGVSTKIHQFSSPTPEEIFQLIETLNRQKEGIIVQLPVAAELQKVLDRIQQNSDVDLLNPNNLLTSKFLPPTIGAIDLVLKNILYPNQSLSELLQFNLNLREKLIAVVGQGRLVGKPLLDYLLAREATIVSLNKYTTLPEQLTNQADILISCAGSPRLVNDNWIKPGAIVLDVATSEQNHQIVGDVDWASIQKDCLIVKSPGGWPDYRSHVVL